MAGTLITSYDVMGGRNTDPRAWNMVNAPFSIYDNGIGNPYTISANASFAPINTALAVDNALAATTWTSILQTTGLVAGVYLILGQAFMLNTSGAAAVNGSLALTNGAAVYYSEGSTSLPLSQFDTVTIQTIVTITPAMVLANTNVIQLAAYASTNTMTIKAATTVAAQGNIATQLMIQRLA